MALESTQPLIEMFTRSISWGYRRPLRKAYSLPPSCVVVMKSVNLNFLEPSGPVQACNGTALFIPLTHWAEYTLYRRYIELQVQYIPRGEIEQVDYLIPSIFRAGYLSKSSGSHSEIS
jgi:hypothetical protein